MAVKHFCMHMPVRRSSGCFDLHSQSTRMPILSPLPAHRAPRPTKPRTMEWFGGVTIMAPRPVVAPKGEAAQFMMDPVRGAMEDVLPPTNPASQNWS